MIHAISSNLFSLTLPKSLASLVAGRDDADLLVRLRRRDPESVGVLYDRYGTVAYDMALRILRNPAKAENAVTEAVLKCWNKVASFRETRGSALGVWLLATTYVNALEQLGRPGAKALERGALFQDWSKTLNSSRVQETHLALRELSSEEKQLLELTFFEGLTPGELAGKWGRSHAEIAELIETALDKLEFIDNE